MGLRLTQQVSTSTINDYRVLAKSMACLLVVRSKPINTQLQKDLASAFDIVERQRSQQSYAIARLSSSK